jgi:four helix bundle protein
MDKKIMKTHKDLEVWKLSMSFVTDVYSLTSNFPKHEIFGLSSQMRRASISIPANISEGSARHSTREWIQFLYISLGSLIELETQIEIAFRLGYVKNIENNTKTIDSIRRLIIALINSLKKKTDH